jgi:hypothetical protein
VHRLGHRCCCRPVGRGRSRITGAAEN